MGIKIVSTKGLSHADWLEYRKQGLGGSDVAAICGLSRYKSPMAVYLDKLGLSEPIADNPKMKAGRMLEDTIAKWFTVETGYKTRNKNAILRHKEHPFMLANIDRWLPELKCGLEIKNTSEYNRAEWEGEQAPTEYVLQCNHYMAVTGADRWFICVLIGGWKLEWKVIERDEALIQNLITIEREFWQNVIEQNPPEFNHMDTDYLKSAYESDPLEEIELPESAYDILQNLKWAKAAEEDAKIAKETAQNQIKGMMQTAEIAKFAGERVATWKTNKKGVRVFKLEGNV